MAESLYAPGETRGKTPPPKWLAFLIQALAPRGYRAAITTNLSGSYTSWPSCCLEAARRIPRATVTESVKAFEARRLIGDLACTFIAFSAAPLATLGPVLAAATLASLWRDGYIHPANPTAKEAGADGLFAGTFILLSQAFLFRLSTSWTLPPVVLLRSLPICMIMIAGCHLIFRIKRPDREPVMEFYSSAWHLTVLWLAGAVALSAGNKNMFLTEGHLRDFLIGLTPLPFILGIRLQSNSISGAPRRMKWITLLSNRRKQDLEAAENMLPGSSLEKSSATRWSARLFTLFFVCLALPVAITVAGTLAGKIPVDDVNWLQLVVNTATFVTLARIWVEIKTINRQVGLQLRREIKTVRMEHRSFMQSIPSQAIQDGNGSTTRAPDLSKSLRL